ncbi:ABC transporter permease subunit [Ignatzschineria rhizosphaerae]|uniref:ABC transporter permease subunit n=1 Tax=Ignatzschineria rhizosphaerae TaxID=2923279 RepID=A0ABY3X364_9GAMM|nr:ABC transporter permease subunit [Ignatzschineria rhizosphaerae]UNM97317.1 ABC transporter permease subunit [Ignatzschineria rhizosphaerae]
MSYLQEVYPLLQSAFWLTLKISFWGILNAFILGMVMSIIIFYRIPILSQIFNGFVAFFRNTPLLLHLFFLYFGFPRAFGIVMSFETTALIGLSLLGSAYMAEAFKSGIQRIASSQLDSGKAIGLNPFQLARYIIVPQAFTYSVPAIGANCIFLFKETSVFTAIAGTDITTVVINLISNNGHTNENLLFLVIAYAIVIIPFTIALTFIERRARYAEFGA